VSPLQVGIGEPLRFPGGRFTVGGVDYPGQTPPVFRVAPKENRKTESEDDK
jgi:hypothetical protein